MLRAVQFACTLPKAEADSLNLESGRINSEMLVSHYRPYRKQGVWLTHEHRSAGKICMVAPHHAACSQPRCR
jgi:hypothetical protein